MTVDKMIEFLEEFEAPEEKFLIFAADINGLVGPGSVALLNGCVKHIDEGNCYLEIGTFQGMSLIGAQMDNSAPCYGVENFAEEFKDNWEKHDPDKQSNRLILEHNLRKYETTNGMVFYQDYREFFASDFNGKVEVYLYDGPHEYDDQVAGLLLAIPLLADRAIVFIDDYKCENVQRSIEHVLSLNNGYVREIKRWIWPYGHFREGFVALEFNRGSQ